MTPTPRLQHVKVGEVFIFAGEKAPRKLLEIDRWYGYFESGWAGLSSPVSRELMEWTSEGWPNQGGTMEKALTLKEVAEKMGLSYHTIFMKRHEIGFRLPGSRVWRVWPSRLAELSKPRNNLIRLSLRERQENELCPSASIHSLASGGSISHRQAAKELDALLAPEAANKRRSTTTD